MSETVEQSRINQWGNGLALRLTSDVAKAAGVAQGTPVKITAVPGRVVIETVERRMSLDDRLARFDPKRHGRGELMDFPPLGREIL